MNLLELKNITKQFGGLTAINNLSFEINEGEILGLIGPNGAGKTTAFNMISGVLMPTKGKIYFKGEDVTKLKTNIIAQRGICRTFQLTTLFNSYSVFDNVLIGCHLSAKTGFWDNLLNTSSVRKGEVKTREKTEEILKFLGIEEISNELAKNLPHGYQRILGIAIAMAACPELLLLDEPMTGMNNTETNDMIEIIRKIRVRGTTILLVEHDMKAVMTLSDRIIVLNNGVKIVEGLPSEVKHNNDVIEAYLGREQDFT